MASGGVKFFRVACHGVETESWWGRLLVQAHRCFEMAEARLGPDERSPQPLVSRGARETLIAESSIAPRGMGRRADGAAMADKSWARW